MAKKREALKVALVLDLDDYGKQLGAARQQGQSEGNAIAGALSDAANKIVLRFASVQAVMRLAEKGFKSFVRTANELERQGRGDDGTAAVARLSSAVSNLWQRFVRATLASEGMRTIIGLLADAVDFLGENMGVVADLTGKATAGLLKFAGEGIVATADVLEKLGGVGDAVAGVLEKLGATGVAASLRESSFGLGLAGGGLLGKGFDLIGRGQEAGASAPKLGTDEEGFKTRLSDVLGFFQSSWQNGLERVGALMRKFSDDTKQNFLGMGKGMGEAVGDLFDSLALSGSMLEKVFGQSEKSSRKFNAAQISLTGLFASVKAIEAGAAAWDLWGDSKFAEAGAKGLAAAGYASTAALAGVGARKALSSGGGGLGRPQGGITNPDNFAEPRRTIFISIDAVAGQEEYIRNFIIPEINRAVGDDVTVLSNGAQGRF